MRKQLAFSLIEILVVLAIIGIGFVFYIPFSSKTLQNNQLEVLENNIINSIQYARTKAMMTGLNLTLNPIAGNMDWSKGMVLFVDNPSHHYSEKDRLIYQWQWQDSPLQVVWHGFRSANFLVLSATIDDRTVNGHFSILFEQNEVSRLVVNRLGRIVAERSIK